MGKPTTLRDFAHEVERGLHEALGYLREVRLSPDPEGQDQGIEWLEAALGTLEGLGERALTIMLEEDRRKPTEEVSL
jgi:hypothetical protein